MEKHTDKAVQEKGTTQRLKLILHDSCCSLDHTRPTNMHRNLKITKIKISPLRHVVGYAVCLNKLKF